MYSYIYVYTKNVCVCKYFKFLVLSTVHCCMGQNKHCCVYLKKERKESSFGGYCTKERVFIVVDLSLGV